MKRIFIFCLLLSIANKIFSQTDTTAPNPSIKTDYLKKGDTQKRVAWGLLGTGTAIMGIGLLVIGNSVESEPNGGPDDAAITGAILFASGLLLDIASIPFFIMGAKNKKKSLSVYFKNEVAPQLRQGSIVQTALPSIGLVIRF